VPIPASCGNLLDLTLAEQSCGPHRPHAKWARSDDIDPDRFGKPLGFLDPRIGRTSRGFPRKLGNGNDCALAPRDLDRAIAVEN
jgi:hypothetical protein